MTQIFRGASPNPMPIEKRGFPGLSMSSKSSNGNSHFPQKLRNFFRLNGLGSSGERNEHSSKSESKGSFRQSKFFGRNRSTTAASEGNILEEGVSPTAQANPYFVHQGPPAIRHHNEGSVPPSPPDTPVNAAPVAEGQATSTGKEELARRLRRVASAPNAQGLFSKIKGSIDRPATAELGKEPLAESTSSNTLNLVDSKVAGVNGHLPIPAQDELGALQPPNIKQAMQFRRTYSSNSIKVRDVEVGPSSFDKIKLIGKGDVGKVYLVREKKSTRLYAMKGILIPLYADL